MVRNGNVFGLVCHRFRLSLPYEVTIFFVCLFLFLKNLWFLFFLLYIVRALYVSFCGFFVVGIDGSTHTHIYVYFFYFIIIYIGLLIFFLSFVYIYMLFLLVVLCFVDKMFQFVFVFDSRARACAIFILFILIN